LESASTGTRLPSSFIAASGNVTDEVLTKFRAVQNIAAHARDDRFTISPGGQLHSAPCFVLLRSALMLYFAFFGFSEAPF